MHYFYARLSPFVPPCIIQDQTYCMLKVLWMLAFLCHAFMMHAQTVPRKKTWIPKPADTLLTRGEETVTDLPMVTLNESDRTENSIASLPPLLHANRDVFMTAAAFHFNSVRFRVRGYEGQYAVTLVNGLSMNNPDDGNTQWSLWGGLNDMTRNTQLSIALRTTDLAFGSIGNTVTIDTRAFKQWSQTQVSTSVANRNYAQRLVLSHAGPMNAKGWCYAVSGSVRYAKEGYTPGTYQSGASYFAAVDKQFTPRNILSFTLFGAALVNGRQSAILEESAALLQTHQYNAYWGYQAGKKRNANESRAHQPVLILTFDHRFSNQSSWLSSVGLVTGEKSSTALDWYHASDPRPDYYRYLPSYQADTLLRRDVTDASQKTISLQQINWDHLYSVNKGSHTATGLRSHYILEARVNDTRRLMLNSVFTALLKTNAFVTAGISFTAQRSHYFKRIDDLLGGDYYVDINAFAGKDFPNDPSVIQNDLNRPNRILHKGDTYGYDYLVNTEWARGWVQLIRSQKKFDLFAAAEISYTNYLRDGKMKTGLFPYDSYGKSALNEFTDYAVKGGVTYKVNGRKYLYLHAAALSKAPLFDNVFLSPRTRDSEQENISSENILSAEFGYAWNAPTIKCRLSAYATQFTNGMNVTTFYHDAYGSFMNYALYGIDKLHVGTELGCEVMLSERYRVNMAAAIGRYGYTSRQQVTVTADNDAFIAERGLIYSKNFRVAGTPQEAYNLGAGYQAQYAFYLNISASYFRQQWLEFNPLRRTYSALEGVTPGSDQWNRITQQTLLPDQYTVDLSAGGSFRVKLSNAGPRKTLAY
ncbi:MAG: TonB-dependent receptor, partial [Sediminibacterium sp.]|nr:TonB-dependent receptor [Sediminibacterium sp.]